MPLCLDPSERERLERWTRSGTCEQRLVRRSRAILLVAAGQSIGEVAAALGMSRNSVRLWARRFEGGGIEAIRVDAPGRGRPSALSVADVERLRALRTDANGEGTPVSIRKLARLYGVAPSTIHRALVVTGADVGSDMGQSQRLSPTQPTEGACFED